MPFHILHHACVLYYLEFVNHNFGGMCMNRVEKTNVAFWLYFIGFYQVFYVILDGFLFKSTNFTGYETDI